MYLSRTSAGPIGARSSYECELSYTRYRSWPSCGRPAPEQQPEHQHERRSGRAADPAAAADRLRRCTGGARPSRRECHSVVHEALASDRHVLPNSLDTPNAISPPTVPSELGENATSTAILAPASSVMIGRRAVSRSGLRRRHRCYRSRSAKPCWRASDWIASTRPTAIRLRALDHRQCEPLVDVERPR